MDESSILVEFHRHNARQGPGSDAATRRAIDLSGLRGRTGLTIADLGCGTGASTFVLAEDLDARITAVDQFSPFLKALTERAAEREVGRSITTLQTSFEELPFTEGSLDAIWSEGAIYTMGFEAGVRAWRRFLKPGGVLAVSDLTWLTADRPTDLEEYWVAEYPEVGLASAKLAVLERQGFTPIGYFPLDRSCWMDNYYAPLRARLPSVLEALGHAPAALACAEAEEREIAVYERHCRHFGYGFYIARRM